MLEVVNISQSISRQNAEPLGVLDHVNFSVPSGHLLAVAGATASGKTVLLKILAGVQKPTNGTVVLQGQDRSNGLAHPNSFGYVPAGDEGLNGALTVRESLMSALFLRVAGLSKSEKIDRTAHILVTVGLETVAKERVAALSPAQRRRLKLGVALVSEPPLVICDDFADGLDARSEREMVALLKLVANDLPNRVVVNSTASLAHLGTHDTVVVLYEGHVAFHGPARAIPHYFTITAMEELYPRLAKRPSERWGESWIRHRDSYYNAFKLGAGAEALAPASDEDETRKVNLEGGEKEGDAKTNEGGDNAVQAAKYPAIPSFGQQASHLIRRRWTTLRRTKKEWIGQLTMLVATPFVMVMMLWPNAIYLKPLMNESESALTPEVLWPAAYTCMMALLLQVLLIAAMSVRNGSREIAAERSLFELERIGGLRVSSYVAGKLGFLVPIVFLQTFSLGLFIEIATGGLPGYALARLVLLALTGAAFTSLCLGISAWSCSAERAHSRAWMLLFNNLILAGALLGFPRVLGAVVQPFVTLYYGWSGSMDTLKETPMFEQATSLVRTWFAPPSFAMAMLLVHFAVGVALMYVGLRKAK